MKKHARSMTLLLPAVILMPLTALLSGCVTSKPVWDSPIHEGLHIDRFGAGEHTITFIVPEGEWRYLVDNKGLKYLTGRDD